MKYLAISVAITVLTIAYVYAVAALMQMQLNPLHWPKWVVVICGFLAATILYKLFK